MGMLEVEAKARISSPGDVKRRIEELGGRFVREVVEEDVYFRHPARDFAESDEALRLRRAGDGCWLTYKGPRIDRITKSREEISVAVQDFEEAKRLLSALGFEELKPVVKRRSCYRLGCYEIMVDRVEGLGAFVEVERRDVYEPEELLALLRKLGAVELERRSYLELALEEGGAGAQKSMNS